MAKLTARSVMGKAAARAVRPRGRLSVGQWADNHRILTSKGSGEVGRWRTSRNPMLREIMECLSVHSPVREIWVMKSSQVGATELSVNWIGYTMEYAPGPMMVLMPTLDARDSWKTQKLNPLLTDTPCIRDMLGGQRSRDAANNKELIDFPGGILFLSGGNSPNSYAQKSARNLMMDDLDRFPTAVGDEGDPVELARSRVKSFVRHKLLFISTPTIKGASLIERGYEAGDQRKYHVACPHCDQRQVLHWAQIRASEDIKSAYYICENGCVIDEYYKTSMLAGGGWVAEHPERKVRSYHISALYAPIGLGPSWLDLVLHFKRVHLDPVQLKTFINQNLGEAWEDQSEKLKSHELAKRAGDFSLGTIPPGVLAITAGIDTQDKWLAITLLGWGAPSHEHGPARLWVLDWAEIQGDTANPQVWNELEAYLHRPLINSYGKSLRIRAAGIDSRGHRAEEVKNFVMRQSLKVQVYAVQGSTSRLGRAIAQTGSVPTKTNSGKLLRHGYMLWNVGTEYCKDHIFANLSADGERSPDERVFNFPQGLETEYFDGLLSEVYDPDKKRYVQRLGAKYLRNEPLDCFDAETEVLTVAGWKLFAKLTAIDLLATVNLAIDEIEYQAPQGLIARHYCGEMVELKSTHIDILVTPGHRMITLKKKQVSTAPGKRKWSFDVSPEITLAKDLTVHHCIKIKSTWRGSEKKNVIITPSVSRRGVKIQPTQKIDSKDLAALMGWWISEGSVFSGRSKTQGNMRHRVEISQTKPEQRAVIRELLGRLPWKWAENKKGFICTSKQLYEYVIQFGRYQHERRVPQWIKDSSPDIIEQFLFAAIAGDGWTQQRKPHHRVSRVYATTSAQLADDIQELFIKIGNAATMRNVNPAGWKINGRSGDACRTQYHVYERLASRAYLDGGGAGKRGFFGKKVHYDGMVYCATVPNGTLILRRGGKTFIAGNCTVYAWAVGHHRNINIGRGRTGRPDLKYWERLAVMLEDGSPIAEYSNPSGAPTITAPASEIKRVPDYNNRTSRHSELMARLRRRHE